MISGNAVFEDLSTFRAQLQHEGAPYQRLLKLNLWRPLWDTWIDWVAIALSVALVFYGGWLMAPAAIVVVANRQRALGNILHDAGHRNLHRSRAINDAVANVLVAPLVFADLASYRDAHFKHHLQLGDAARDPDYLHPLAHRSVGWLHNYARNVLSVNAWWSSVSGHLGNSSVPLVARLYIVAWWSAAGSALTLLAGWRFTEVFLLIWFVARGTVFHGITMFREMCDHFGLRPGGVLSFTRDILRHGFWYGMVHPRNNGYHLTHHLLPAVPYYRLPQAQELFARMPMYHESGRVYSTYIFGPGAVVRGWRTGTGA
ncbi:fatty acid desaturase [Ideonella sp. YS5]|uniref:fatty acid desaturase n=1 Tax=Ideonella sp. YS5 TaxID=3453714 RepID=UPI003EEFF6E2